MEKLVSPLLLSPKIRKQYDQVTYKFSSILHHIIILLTDSKKSSAKLNSFLQESCKLVLHLYIKMYMRYVFSDGN